MDGDGHDKEQDVVDGAVVGMCLGVETRNLVEVWSHVVKHIEEKRSSHYADHYNPVAPPFDHIKGRDDEA